MTLSGITSLLDSAAAGDRTATDRLFTAVYEQLRQMANIRIAGEAPQTLQSTALVHEVWVKLVGKQGIQRWNNGQHFFAAAAQAMRRILVDSAKARQRIKRGGGKASFELREDDAVIRADENLLALDEALEQLRSHDEQKAQLVCLRYFGGLSSQQAAEQLGISNSTAERHWVFAKAWLRARIEAD